jgi:hypothetical protein
MRKLIVMTAALLASTALAAAQGMNQGNKSEGASPAPAQQRSAPAEKMGQSKGAQMKPSETSGQAQKDQGAQKADDKRPANAQMNKQDDKAGATTGQKSTMDSKPDANKAAADKPKTDTNKAASDTKANDTNRAATTNQRDTQTTGQGAAGSRAAVNLTAEQKTKVRTVIKEKVKAQPLTNVNFSISVGTKVPREVHYYPIPTEIVEIHPAWRGYYFILVNDQIVIIEPSSFEIVAVIA